METKTTNKHFSSFYIAGFTFWERCLAFSELRIGNKLNLVREADNRFDPYAVAIYYKDYKLGYIPRGENQTIAQFLDLGFNTLFDVRVQRLSPDANPERQVGVVVFAREANKVLNK